jgi:two-component system LytT family sensor kinase
MLAFLAGTALGALGVVLIVFAWRVVRGGRGLTTPAERATLETLHHASRAAAFLRGGLSAGEPMRAAKALRALLECDALAIADDHGLVALDGPAALSTEAEHLARSAREQGITQALPHSTAGARDDGRAVTAERSMDAVAAPIRIGGRSGDGPLVGALVAFTPPPARASLVRAVEEAADWVAAQLELTELDASRAALAEAEVKALRAQISPHFIYNALTAIAATITTDPPRARELVLEFADFTRYSFRRTGEFTTLADELRSIDSYLQLERARFGDRLAVTLQIAPEVLPTVIPFLSLQPLVENAVRHGLEPKEGGGTISITAVEAGAFTEVRIDDDGVGTDPEALRAALAGRPTVDHLGLRNVDARLRQRYGDDCGLIVETQHGAGTLVIMRVPRSQPQHDAAGVLS